MESLIGRTIGAYRIESKIGEGGNSDVFMARDTANGERPVALKVLRLEHHSDQSKIERFWRSGHGARELQHPHIVPVYEAGMADSRYYIAMEYMAGRSVEDLLHEQGGTLSGPVALRYLEQIAGAIDYAHSRGVIHRDIKPSNILLSVDRRNAYLTDFGIALLTGQSTKTEHGALIGTPEFISPEQIRGEKAGIRSDIYSLGITAYQMLSGRLPYEGPPAVVLYNHVNTPPPSIRAANARLPRDVSRPMGKVLAKDPRRRYASAAEFVRDLAAALSRKGGPSRRLLWAALALPALLVGWLIFFPPGNGGPVTVTRLVTITPAGGVGLPAGSTSTVAPTSLPTSTSRPSSATVVTPPTGTAPAPMTPPPAETRATAAPTTAPRVAAPVPLYPPDGADIPRGAAKQTFQWEWERSPAADESFELRFYPADGGSYLAPFGWIKQNNVAVDLNALPAGSYRWVVVVVRGLDGKWEEDITESASRSLTWGR